MTMDQLEHHRDLAHEFPEFRDRIHILKIESPAFRDLYAEYQELDDEIHRIELDIETPSDEYTETLKRRRVLLKDRLYAMLTGRRAAAPETDEYVVRHKFDTPVDVATVTRNWIGRGFTCRAFIDPAGQEWLDFVHPTDELVTVIKGRLEVEMRGETWQLEPGDELYIPRGVTHTVRNVHNRPTHWLYGYD